MLQNGLLFPAGSFLFSYFFGFGAQRCPKRAPRAPKGGQRAQKATILESKRCPKQQKSIKKCAKYTEVRRSSSVAEWREAWVDNFIYVFLFFILFLSDYIYIYPPTLVAVERVGVRLQTCLKIAVAVADINILRYWDIKTLRS